MSARGPWRGNAARAQRSKSTQDSGVPRPTTSAMIASIGAEGQRTSAAPFGKALIEIARQRPEILGMTADLAKYTDLHVFAAEYPDRFYQMGMAEQLLMLAAAGMAREGFTPFVTPMRYSPLAVPTTSSARASLKKGSTSKSAAPSPA